jgi:hypothetical protein
MYTDASGEEVPYDLEFHGIEGMVSGELIKYSEPILNIVKAFLDTTGTDDSTAGVMGSGSIGTLIRTEQRDFGLAIRSAYGASGPAAKPVYVTAGMNAGFLFGSAIPVGSFNSGLGAKTKRETIQFRCLPIWTFFGGGPLYSNDLSGVSLPDPS